MQSIGIKINFLNISLSLLCLLSSTSFWAWQLNASLNKQFLQSTQIFTTLQAQQIAPLLHAENLNQLTQTVTNLSAHPGIAYVLLCDSEQKLILQRNFHSLSKLPTPPCHTEQDQTAKHFTDPQTGLNFLNVTTGLQLKISSSAVDGKVTEILDLDNNLSHIQNLGTLRLGFSLQQLQQEQRNSLGYGLCIGILLLLILSVCSWWYTRRLVFPVKQLLLQAYDQLGWESAQSHSAHTQDELRQLTKVFNRISLELATAQQQQSQAQNELEASQKKLESQQHANLEAVTSLPTQISHIPQNSLLIALNQDLHTPINGVLGMLELLQHTTLNSQQQHLAHSAKRSAELLDIIMSNILDVAAFVTGRLHLAELDFEIRSELENIASLMAAQAYYQGLEFILDLPCELNSLVRGDAKRLRQIVINLLGFMLKHTEVGDITLRVTITSTAEQKSAESLQFEIFGNLPDASVKHLTYLFSITRLKPPASSRLASADKMMDFEVCHGLQVWQSYGFSN